MAVVPAMLIIGCLTAVIHSTSSQANQGWESAPKSTPENGEVLNPLHSVLAMVRFECADRAGGYYGDMDFGCSVFHYCATEGQRFTFKCSDGLKFNEDTVTCSAGFFGDCSHPEIIGSAGRNMTASPAPVKSFQNSPVFMKPVEDKSNDDPRDYPDGFLQHDDPALEIDFEEYITDNNEDLQSALSINHGSSLAQKNIKEESDLASKSVLSAFASLANLPLDNQVSGTASVERYQRPIDRAFVARPPRRYQHHRNSILRPIPFAGGISKTKPGRVHPTQYNNAGVNLIPMQPPHPYNTYREGDIQLSLNLKPEVENKEYFVQTTTKPFRPSELITDSNLELNAVTPESKSYSNEDVNNFIQPDAEAGDHIRPYRDANTQTDGTSTSFQRFSPFLSSNIPNGGFPLHTTPNPRVFQTSAEEFLNVPVFPPSGNFVYNQPPIHPSSPLFNTNTFLHTFPTGSLSQSIQPIQSPHSNTRPQSPHPNTRLQSPHPNTRPQSPHPNTRPQSPHPNTRLQSPHPNTRPQSPHPNTRPQSPHPNSRPQLPHSNTRPVNLQLQPIISPQSFSRFQPPRPSFHVTPPPLRDIPASQNNFPQTHLNQPQFQGTRPTSHEQINQNRPQFISPHEPLRPIDPSTHFRDNTAQTFNPNTAIQSNPHLNQQFEIKHQDPAFNHPNVQLHTNPFSQPHSDLSFMHIQTNFQPEQSNEDHKFSQFTEIPQHPPIHKDPQFPHFSLDGNSASPQTPVQQQLPMQKQDQFAFDKERIEPTTSTQFQTKPKMTENSVTPVPHHRPVTHQFTRRPHRRPVNHQFPRQPLNPQINERHEPTSVPLSTDTQPSSVAPLTRDFIEKENDFSQVPQFVEDHRIPTTPHHQVTRLDNSNVQGQFIRPHRRPVNHQFPRQPLIPQINEKLEPTSVPLLTNTQPSSVAPITHDFIDEENNFSHVPQFVEDHRIPTAPHHHVTELENSDVHGQFIEPDHEIQDQQHNVPYLIDENIIQDEIDNDQSVVPTTTPIITVLEFTGFRQSGEQFDSVQSMPHALSPIPVESESSFLTDIPAVQPFNFDNIPHNDIHSALSKEENDTFDPEISNTVPSINIMNHSTRIPSTRIPSTRMPSTRIPSTREPSTRVPSTRIPVLTRGSQRPTRTRARLTTQKTTIAPSTTTSIFVTKEMESEKNDDISSSVSQVRTTSAPSAISFKERLNRYRARKNRTKLSTTTSLPTTTVTPIIKSFNRITAIPRSDTTRRTLASDRFKAFRNRLRTRNNDSTTKSPSVEISTTATPQRPSEKENLRSNLQNTQFNGLKVNSEENVLQVKEIIKKQDSSHNDFLKTEELTKSESFEVQQENESTQHPEIENEPLSRRMDDPDVRSRFREFLKNRRNRLSSRFRSTIAPKVSFDTTTAPNTATENIKSIMTDVSEIKTEVPFETSTMIVKERMNTPNNRPFGGRRRVLVARKLIQDENGETRIARKIIPGGRPLRNRVIPTIGLRNFEDRLALDDKQIMDTEFKFESKVKLDSSVSSTSEKNEFDTFSFSPSTLSAEFVPQPFHLPAQAIQEKIEMNPKSGKINENEDIISEMEIITAPPEIFSIQVSADLSGKKNPASSFEKEDIQMGSHDSKPAESEAPLESFSSLDESDIKKKDTEATISPLITTTIEVPKELSENQNFLPSVLTASEKSKSTLSKMEKFQFKRPSISRQQSRSSTTQSPIKTTLADLLTASKPRFQRPSKASVTTTESSETFDIKPLDYMFIIPSSSNIKNDKSEKNRPDHRHSRPSFSFDILSKKNKTDGPVPISALDISEENYYKREENVTPAPFLSITMATDSPFLPLEMLWDFKR